MAIGLKRSESLLFLPTPALESVPYYKTKGFYKEQRKRRRASEDQDDGQVMIRCKSKPRSIPTLPVKLPSKKSVTLVPTCPPPKVILPSPRTQLACTPRTSSLLSPNPHATILRAPCSYPPARPRAKPQQNLHRDAIRSCMRSSEQGRKVLELGPKLAMEVVQTHREIVRVTRELEEIVDQSDEDAEGEDDFEFDGAIYMSMDSDVEMRNATATAPVSALMPQAPRIATAPLPLLTPLLPSFQAPIPTSCSPPRSSSPLQPVLTTSWVVVKGDDWEMVECAA